MNAISNLKSQLASAVSAAIDADRRTPEWKESREEIARIGQLLHQAGGLKAMEDALYAVADRYDEPLYGRAVDVIDKRFDGIGGWAA